MQILTPRKLFILPSKVSVFPSNAVSLEEATPRFDDTRGTVHLDVSHSRGGGQQLTFREHAPVAIWGSACKCAYVVLRLGRCTM